MAIYEQAITTKKFTVCFSLSGVCHKGARELVDTYATVSAEDEEGALWAAFALTAKERRFTPYVADLLEQAAEADGLAVDGDLTARVCVRERKA